MLDQEGVAATSPQAPARGNAAATDETAPPFDRVIAVVGLGYVGLPVAVAFAHAGARVIAFDIDAARVADLHRGIDPTREVSAAELAAASIQWTTDAEALGRADFFIVTVPTPLGEAKQPDLGPLLLASETVGRALRPGAIVVYESTVYPGATEEECLPVLEQASGLVAGEDFFLSYSPERINPGDGAHRLGNVVKVVSAQTPDTLDIVARVYGRVVPAGIHRAPSIRVAEAAKAIENAQRDLNIAFVNELACIFDRLDLDTREVLEAAATKWNFLPFAPGLVGGHCIGVDPYYLAHRAQRAGCYPEMILAGRRVNDGMGAFVARRCIRMLMRSRTVDHRVTVLGVSYKENVPDLRNSPVLGLVRELCEHGIAVQIADPLADPVMAERAFGIPLSPVPRLEPAHAVILTTAHDAYVAAGWDLMLGCLRHGSGAVLDVRGCLDRRRVPPKVEYWRL